MSEPGKIPISDAADICKKRGCAYVIIFGLRADGERFNVTTYGMTKKLCKLAGNIGDQFAGAVLDGRVKPPEKEPPDVNADLLAACKEALKAIDEAYVATGFIKVAYISEQRMRIEAAIAKAEPHA